MDNLAFPQIMIDTRPTVPATEASVVRQDSHFVTPLMTCDKPVESFSI